MKLDLDWWAQDHKDVTLWSEARRGSVGCWGLEHRPAKRSCKSFSSLEEKREKEIAWVSATAIWTGEAQTGPASLWRCLRLGREATETHCSMANSLPRRNWFVKKPLTKQMKHMMVLKRWNRLPKNTLECPSVARGVQNPSGQGPEQADVI